MATQTPATDLLAVDEQRRVKTACGLVDIPSPIGSEQVLSEHPAVAAVAVPSELSADEVMAAVVLEEAASVEPVELMRHCEGRLAYFAIPRYLELLDELPLTDDGKGRKAILHECRVGERTWDREAAGYRLARR
jgi:crotonobetaine/carnitine-CoA ligase